MSSNHFRRLTNGSILTTAILVISLLLYLIVFHRNLDERLSYPPTSDQTMYLAGGRIFAEESLFFWRSPLYGLWMGIFYLISGNDPRTCFYNEKYASMYLLGLAIAVLGKRLFDLQTGLLLGFWTLNCKYLVIETNGSHVFAAVLFTASLIALTISRKDARLPIALLFLWLSTQARSEMWVPFIFILIVLLVLVLRKEKSGRHFTLNLNPRSSRYWLICTAIAVALFVLFQLRASPPEPGRLSEAFAMNFAMNYADRHNLHSDSSPEDLNWVNLWVKVFPGISPSAEAIEHDRGQIHPFAAITKYPNEILLHIAYNLKLFAKAFPATVLAFDRLNVAAVVLLIYLTSIVIFFRSSNYQHLWWVRTAQDRNFLLIWSLSIFSLIPISFILRVVARYYIQLMPIIMIFVIGFAFQLLSNFHWRRLIEKRSRLFV